MTQRVVNYTYGTGNPVLPDGSIDVRDGIDNLQSMDVFMNAPEDTYNQRDGEIVRTVAGMNNEFDAHILNMSFTRIGTFAAGATLTNQRQTLLWDVADGGDGQEYGWSGTFPKAVPAASTPASTGGISVGAWISRVDPALRVQVREALRRSYAEEGYNLVEGSFEAGGALVNANDVLLHETSGKAYSGSTGTVAPGTNPTSGGFVDVSGVVSNPRSFRSFGATGLGIADDTTALRDAIIWAGSLKGRRVYGTPGDVYRITGELTVRWDGKFLDESSSCVIDFTGTTFNVDADNITALRISRNYVKVYHPSVDSYGSRVGVTAYAIAPEDEAQTTQKVSQMFCEIHNPSARNVSIGIRFRPGPTVGGQDSGSFYHVVYNPKFYNVNRGFYFARCVTGTNLTTRVEVYSPIHHTGHCAWDIEAADSLTVFGGSAEFMTAAGPHTGTPTIKVHKPVPSDTLSSSNIMFLRYYGEVGVTPFDLMTSESISMPGCTFFGYTNQGVSAGGYTLQNMFANEGAIVSRAKYSGDSFPMLGVRREVGANAGQANLIYQNRPNFPAVFSADRGFTFDSPIDKAPIRDLRNTESNIQILGTSVGSVSTIVDAATGTYTLLNNSGLAGRAIEFGGVFSIGPDGDNTVTGGKPSKRYSTIYAANGVQTTSDARLKTPTRPIDDVDIAIGKQIMSAIGWGEWLADSESNRTHCWVTVQAVIQAFEDHGRNAFDYSMVCHDEWGDSADIVNDDTGEVMSNGVQAGDIYSLRSHELASFLIAVNHARLEALE